MYIGAGTYGHHALLVRGEAAVGAGATPIKLCAPWVVDLGDAGG